MRDGFVLHGAEGALGGAVGTLLIKQGMTLRRRLPRRPTHEPIAGGLHWAYGIAWGSLLGIAVSGLHVKTARQTLLAGAGMGALVWAVGYVGWLPQAGRMVPVQGAGRVVTSLASHVLYGIAASVPIVVIDRERRRRLSWWRRLVD